MVTLGGILGMPNPTGTPGPAGGVETGGAPAGAPEAGSTGGTAFGAFFDAVVAAASEQGEAPPDAVPAAILALLGQDVPQTPGAAAAAPGHRARLFRMHDGLDREGVEPAPAGADKDNQTVDVVAAMAVDLAPLGEPQAAPSGTTTAPEQAGRVAPEQAASTARASGPRVTSHEVVEEVEPELTGPDTARLTPDVAAADAEPERPAQTAQPGAEAAPPSGAPVRMSTTPVSRSAEAPTPMPRGADGAPVARMAATATTSEVEHSPQVQEPMNGAAEPRTGQEERAARVEDAVRDEGPTQLGALPRASHARGERRDARTPEASTGPGEGGSEAPGGATVDRVAGDAGRLSFESENGGADSRNGSQGDRAAARQMSVGPQPTVPAAHAPAGQPATAAEPQPVPARLTPELGGPVTSQIVQSLRTQLRGGIGEAVVRLKPEFLGEVTITVRLDRGQVDASVKAALPAVREWIEAQEPAVRQSLGEQGLSLTRLRVEPDGQRAFSDDGRQEQPSPDGRRARPRQQRQSEERFELLV